LYGGRCPLIYHVKILVGVIRSKSILCPIKSLSYRRINCGIFAFVTIVLHTPITMAQAPTTTTPTIQPNENLVVEGIPAIPSRLASQVDRYTQFRSASLSSWHPTRREMLIATRFADVAQIHQVKMPLGMRRQLTFFPERVSGASFQPSQGNYFVFSKDTGGNEFGQNYRYDLATGDVTLLTDGQSKNSRGAWSRRGDRMAYSSTRRTGGDNDFYVIDPLQPQSNRLLTQNPGGGWYILDWSPDDRQILAIEYVSVNESYLWLVDVQSGQKTLVTPKGNQPSISYSSAIFSHDGKGLYVVSDRDSEFQRLVYFDFATQQQTVLSRDINWDVEDVSLSDNGEYLAFTTNEDGASVLHVLNTTTKTLMPLPKLPVGLVLGLDWHRNSQDLGLTLISAKSTADVYSINLKTQTLERWTESETGGLNTAQFADATVVRWPSFDRKTISGFLYRPPSAKFSGKRPVIIDIHGGPEGQSRPYFLGRMNYYLNELGVAIIMPNVRGSSGYGKTFLTLDNGKLREDSVQDIGALLDWIKTQPDLDADRILVTGGSYGGYMSLAVATKYSDRIKAAIDIVGISNFVSFLERTEEYRRDLRRVEYGDERDPAMRQFLTQISPTTNAAAIKVPLFVIHGKNDPRVPLNEAEQIVKTVRNNRVPVWYLMAKDEGHGFSKKRNVDYQFYATVSFIQEFLLK
jgi:dipeptidyl aminopeptidase/acylaminoacyl peptidase